MKAKGTQKPKYNLLQNMRYIFHTTWTLDKTLILFTFGTAILNLCQTIVQLFIAPMILQKVEQNAPLDELLFTILIFCVLLVTLAGLIGYLTNEELDYGLRVRLMNHFTVLATEKANSTKSLNSIFTFWSSFVLNARSHSNASLLVAKPLFVVCLRVPVQSL